MQVDISKEVAKILLEKFAVKVSVNNLFTWTSGIKSPIYCDNRLLISYPEEREKIIEGFKLKIKENDLKFDVIGGTSTAGIPWASFLAQSLNLPMIYIRSKPKSHGAGNQIEGTMKKYSKVLIVEDLLSTGGSAVSSIKACQKEFDAEVIAVLGIFSYGFSVLENSFKNINIPFFTLSNYKSILEELNISLEEKIILKDFSKNPKIWAKNNNL
jgi:orotate phosphoribosyltransferase